MCNVHLMCTMFCTMKVQKHVQIAPRLHHFLHHPRCNLHRFFVPSKVQFAPFFAPFHVHFAPFFAPLQVQLAPFFAPLQVQFAPSFPQTIAPCQRRNQSILQSRELGGAKNGPNCTWSGAKKVQTAPWMMKKWCKLHLGWCKQWCKRGAICTCFCTFMVQRMVHMSFKFQCFAPMM